MLLRSLIVGASVALCAGTTALAAPYSREEVAQSAVFFADLNTANPEDAAELYSRVRRAALRVCRDRPGARDLSVARETRRCVKEAVDRAITDLDAPLVTAVHLDGQRPRTFSIRQALRLDARD